MARVTTEQMLEWLGEHQWKTTMDAGDGHPALVQAKEYVEIRRRVELCDELPSALRKAAEFMQHDDEARTRCAVLKQTKWGPGVPNAQCDCGYDACIDAVEALLAEIGGDE